MSGRETLVGAVAYHPRVVTVWERFRTHFMEAGIPTDYLLYSNYERLVAALLADEVQIAWNTNTAWVAAEHRAGGATRLLGMRDIDRDYRTVIVRPRGEAVDSLSDLAGRRFAVGSSDCGHSTILPIHYLAREGVAAETETTLLRYEGDPGKHGDTGGPELLVLEAVASGDADAGAVADVVWARLRSQGEPVVSGLELAWRSPTYYHCNFTALPELDPELAAEWTQALLAMDYTDPSLRPAMDLEGVRRWHPADKEGYAELAEAMTEQGYL